VPEDPGAGDDERQQWCRSPDRHRRARDARGDDSERGGLGHPFAEVLCEHRRYADGRGEHGEQGIDEQRIQRTQPLEFALEPLHLANVANRRFEHIRLAMDERVIREMYAARLVTNHLLADEIGS
jgi:hypothetical protein